MNSIWPIRVSTTEICVCECDKRAMRLLYIIFAHNCMQKHVCAGKRENERKRARGLQCKCLFKWCIAKLKGNHSWARVRERVDKEMTPTTKYYDNSIDHTKMNATITVVIV